MSLQSPLCGVPLLSAQICCTENLSQEELTRTHHLMLGEVKTIPFQWYPTSFPGTGTGILERGMQASTHSWGRYTELCANTQTRSCALVYERHQYQCQLSCPSQSNYPKAHLGKRIWSTKTVPQWKSEGQCVSQNRAIWASLEQRPAAWFVLMSKWRAVIGTAWHSATWRISQDIHCHTWINLCSSTDVLLLSGLQMQGKLWVCAIAFPKAVCMCLNS